MIAEDFTAQANAIPYPDRADFPENVEFIEARRSYDEAHGELNGAFAAALAEEYLGTISEPRRSAIAAKTFGLAWEHGHSSGYSDIENYYIDFAAFAEVVYSTATS